MNFVEIIQNRDSEKSRQISTKLGVFCLFSKFSRLVPEFGGLGYFTRYPSQPNSGTNLPNFENRSDLYSGAPQIGPFPAKDFFTNS